MASTSPASAGDEASAPLMTSRVRVQISLASCSTQPARGVICSCSRWSTWTISPSWSNRMKRELVVPWSIAPTYCGMSAHLRGLVAGGGAARPVDDVLALLDDFGVGRGPAGEQRLADQPVVDEGADGRSDQGPDKRDPEVRVHVPVVPGHGDLLPALDPGHQPRSEVAGRVDGVARVGAVGQADGHDDEADDDRGQVRLDRRVVLVGHG